MTEGGDENRAQRANKQTIMWQQAFELVQISTLVCRVVKMETSSF